MPEKKPAAPAQPKRDPEEEGSAARPPQPPQPADQDPEEEGSAGRPER
jgi:hypothetical protein